MTNRRVQRRKMVVIGDGGCGKTSLLLVYGKGEFPESYVPTVFENFITNCTVDGENFELAIWDTAGQEEYDRLRPLSYPGANIILICYSIESRASYENVTAKWYPEVNHFCPTTPVLLVGCKADLRDDPEAVEDEGLAMVETVEGWSLKEKIRAVDFVECSALKGAGVSEVFDKATRAAANSRTKKQTRACVLI